MTHTLLEGAVMGSRARLLFGFDTAVNAAAGFSEVSADVQSVAISMSDPDSP